MSFGFGFALPAYPLRGGGGNNPFNQLGATLDLSFAGVVTDQSDPNGYTLNTDFIIPQYQIAAQYVVWETGVGLVDKTFSQIITFSRSSGATWFNFAGILQGVDFSVTSNTIGTGSKTFTLDATAGVNRYWTAGDTVLISDQANSANNMVGTVTSYNASTQVLVCDITSTGGSGTITSWRIGSTMPRLDYNPSTLAAQGLLIEEARTNLALQSQDFATSWAATASPIVTTNTTVAPDGTTTADTIASTAIGSYVSQTITFTGDGTKAYSIFIKSGTSSNTRISVRDITASVSRGQADITWAAGVPSAVVINGSLQYLQACPNGWYRLAVIVDSVVAANTNQIRIQPDNVSGTGDVIFWGAQIENAAFSTSYIPTTTTALTRSADVASVNTLSPWYNATEGTLFAQAQDMSDAAHASAQPRAASINDGTTGNRIDISRLPASAQSRANVFTGGASQFNSLNTAWPLSTQAKIALAYKAADFAACLGGGTVASVASGTVPTVSALTIGNVTTGGTSGWVGWIQRIAYYPRRLSNAELQAITA